MTDIISKQLLLFQHAAIGLLMVGTIFWVNASVAHAHGGKNHADNNFTALQAIQKAIAAYDKLIVGGKLDESWETGLRSVETAMRERDGQKEYRVSFQKVEGTPNTVYIFYSMSGEYAGSNFDGN